MKAEPAVPPRRRSVLSKEQQRTLVGDPTATGSAGGHPADLRERRHAVQPELRPQPGHQQPGQAVRSGDAVKGFKYSDSRGEQSAVKSLSIALKPGGTFRIKATISSKMGPSRLCPGPWHQRVRGRASRGQRDVRRPLHAQFGPGASSRTRTPRCSGRPSRGTGRMPSGVTTTTTSTRADHHVDHLHYEQHDHHDVDHLHDEQHDHDDVDHLHNEHNNHHDVDDHLDDSAVHARAELHDPLYPFNYLDLFDNLSFGSFQEAYAYCVAKCDSAPGCVEIWVANDCDGGPTASWCLTGAADTGSNSDLAGRAARSSATTRRSRRAPGGTSSCPEASTVQRASTCSRQDPVEPHGEVGKPAGSGQVGADLSGISVRRSWGGGKRTSVSGDRVRNAGDRVRDFKSRAR